MRHLLLGAACIFALSMVPPVVAQTTGSSPAPLSTTQPPVLDFEATAAIRDAVGSTSRSISNIMRDAHRNPQATLEFFGIREDHTVVEIWPGQGWYTEVLAPLLHDEGKLIAAHFPQDSDVEFFQKARADYERMLQRRDVYDVVEMATLDYDPGNPIAEPGTADRVVTFRNVHNWLAVGMDETRTVFAKMFDVLKPGGAFVAKVFQGANAWAVLKDRLQAKTLQASITEAKVQEKKLADKSTEAEEDLEEAHDAAKSARESLAHAENALTQALASASNIKDACEQAGTKRKSLEDQLARVVSQRAA